MEKKIRSVIILWVCFLCLLFTGCKSTASQSGDTQSVSRAGYVAVGRLDQLNRDAQRVQQQFGTELESISGTASDLRTTVYQLVDFSQRLLHEYESLQRQIGALTKDSENIVDRSNRVDAP